MMNRVVVRLLVPMAWLALCFVVVDCQQRVSIDLFPFWDSAHHWYDIHDEDRVIEPLPHQQQYAPSQIRQIADNIVLFQRSNGGWPKNYDMAAVLTDSQRRAVLAAKTDTNATTFDNGATHSQVAYLAKAFTLTRDARYRTACLRGIDFILRAQYQNGGWPQFYPDRSGYRRYITFNDGAMIGVMTVLQQIVDDDPSFSFVDAPRRSQLRRAFRQGIDCILRTQVRMGDSLTVWCQQHDDVTLEPRKARSFELASLCSMESGEIVLFLMGLKNPSPEVVNAVHAAVSWFRGSELYGIRVDTITAPRTDYRYHTTSTDKVVVRDPSAPPLWARFYELGTNVPLFANRDGKPVYSLAEVDRERRTGYAWYTYEPEAVLEAFSHWNQRSR